MEACVRCEWRLASHLVLIGCVEGCLRGLSRLC